jgi:hypothetical protein
VFIYTNMCICIYVHIHIYIHTDKYTHECIDMYIDKQLIIIIRYHYRLALQKSTDPLSDLIPTSLRFWHPFGDFMIEAIKNHLDPSVWKILSPKMYLSFWCLSLYDIQCPVEKYENELKRLRERSKVLLMPIPPIRAQGTYIMIGISILCICFLIL